MKCIENGGIELNKLEFDNARTYYLKNAKIKKGIELFEKYVGRIEFLHPEDEKYKVVGNKKYRVIDKQGEVVFESDNITNIAKEFCLSVSRVANSINTLSFIKGEYLVERCGDE